MVNIQYDENHKWKTYKSIKYTFLIFFFFFLRANSFFLCTFARLICTHTCEERS